MMDNPRGCQGELWQAWVMVKEKCKVGGVMTNRGNLHRNPRQFPIAVCPAFHRLLSIFSPVLTFKRRLFPSTTSPNGFFYLRCLLRWQAQAEIPARSFSGTSPA